MSRMEGDFRFTSFFVDPPGLQDRRQNQGLYQTFQIFPLDIRLKDYGSACYSRAAFLLAVPCIGGLKPLSVTGLLYPYSPVSGAFLPVLAEHFSRPVPLLQRLKVGFVCDPTPTLPDTLFGGVLPSLRELILSGVSTSLSWGGLENLTTFILSEVPKEKILLVHLLDFFESAPHLHHIELRRAFPDISDDHSRRIASLPDLKKLIIISNIPHSIPLNHLSIPSGASVILEFTFKGDERSPIPANLPKDLDNIHNLSHITTINLSFGLERRAMQLKGPSGELHVLGAWIREDARTNTGASRLMRFLDRFDTSRCRWLGITQYNTHRSHPPPSESTPITSWAPYQSLLLMGNLHTLALIECNNLHFIIALDPSKNPSEFIQCPKLKEVILYIDHPDRLCIVDLLDMAEGRALRGAKLSTLIVVRTDPLASMDVFQLRDHISRVEYRFDNVSPAWDALPSSSWCERVL